MNKEQKKYLLQIARKSIETYLNNEKYFPEEPNDNELKKKSGVFVTLNKNHNLRGCIGFIVGVKPLYEAVYTMAREAAFNDPRFPELNNKELKYIDIEISVMTPLKKIDNIEEIKVGKHGIYIKKGFYSGLLLPQVATDWGYNREQFLQNTCMKAGMQPDCYKYSETEIYIFECEIFSEGELNE